MDGGKECYVVEIDLLIVYPGGELESTAFS